LSYTGEKVLQALKTKLTDLTYIQTKIAGVGTNTLLDEFAQIATDPLLESIATALRLGASILDAHPEELQNQLRGRLGDIPELHNPPINLQPHFHLESQTLTSPDNPLIRKFSGNDDKFYRAKINSLVVSPDGHTIVSASDDTLMKAWDVATGNPLRSFSGHTARVLRVAFSPDGKHIVSASADKTMRLWDASSTECLRIFKGHTDQVWGCAVSPDGQYLLSGSSDKTLRLWNISTAETIRIFTGHTGAIHTCSLSPDGQLALSVGTFEKRHEEKALRLWRVSSGEQLDVVNGVHYEAVFSSDGSNVLFCGDNRLVLWNIASKQIIREFQTDLVTFLHECAFSPDGRFVLGADSNTLWLWNTEDASPIGVIETHIFSMSCCCAVSPDSRYVVNGSDHEISLWDIQRARKEHSMGFIRDCVFSHDGKEILVTSVKFPLQLWNAKSRQLIKTYDDIQGTQLCVFSPDGEYILTVEYKQREILNLRDKLTGQLIRTFEGHADEIHCCAFSPDGQYVVSGSGRHGSDILIGPRKPFDDSLRVWEVASGKQVQFLKHHDQVNDCAFSPNGEYVLTAAGTLIAPHGYSLEAFLWNISTGQAEATFEEHDAIITCCDFSPNGQVLATGSWDNTLRVIDFESKQTLHVLNGHTSTVEACTFTSESLYLISISHDKQLILWNVLTGNRVASWEAECPLECFDLHGKQIIVGDRHGNLHFLMLENV
jgi:WD40 repeat protein